VCFLGSVFRQLQSGTASGVCVSCSLTGATQTVQRVLPPLSVIAPTTLPPGALVLPGPHSPSSAIRLCLFPPYKTLSCLPRSLLFAGPAAPPPSPLGIHTPSRPSPPPPPPSPPPPPPQSQLPGSPRPLCPGTTAIAVPVGSAGRRWTLRE